MNSLVAVVILISFGLITYGVITYRVRRRREKKEVGVVVALAGVLMLLGTIFAVVIVNFTGR